MYNMERLNDCLELVHSTWLASPLNCCFPQTLQDQLLHKESRGPLASKFGMYESSGAALCTR